MAAAPPCSFCPGAAVRQGRPLGSGGQFVPMCGSDRCAAELSNRSNLALVGRPMGEQLGQWLETLRSKLDASAASAVIAAAKREANNSRVNTSMLTGYTFLMFPQVVGGPELPPERRFYVSSLPLRNTDTMQSSLIDKTLNTAELMAEHVRMFTDQIPGVVVVASAGFVLVIEDGRVRYTIAPLMPIGSTTEPSFWIITGDGKHLGK